MHDISLTGTVRGEEIKPYADLIPKDVFPNGRLGLRPVQRFSIDVVALRKAILETLREVGFELDDMEGRVLNPVQGNYRLSVEVSQFSECGSETYKTTGGVTLENGRVVRTADFRVGRVVSNTYVSLGRFPVSVRCTLHEELPWVYVDGRLTSDDSLPDGMRARMNEMFSDLYGISDEPLAVKSNQTSDVSLLLNMGRNHILRRTD